MQFVINSLCGRGWRWRSQRCELDAFLIDAGQEQSEEIDNPVGELHTSPDPLTVREYMGSACTVQCKVWIHYTEYQISPDRSILLLHKERLCTCLHVFVYVSVATWISLEVLAVFYVCLLAGVFLSDWFAGFYDYVCVWLRMWIGDMLTTVRGEIEQVGGNLVWLVGPHTDIWVVFKPSCPDWGWHFEKGHSAACHNLSSCMHPCSEVIRPGRSRSLWDHTPAREQMLGPPASRAGVGGRSGYGVLVESDICEVEKNIDC